MRPTATKAAAAPRTPAAEWDVERVAPLFAVELGTAEPVADAVTVAAATPEG